MKNEHDLSGIDSMAHGDERAARELRANIAAIARRTEDRSLRDLCVQVLEGRESVRRVFAHGSFWQMATQNMENLEQGLDRLSDEQREDLLGRVGTERTDDDEIGALRDQEPPPPPPEDRTPPRWG